MCAQICPNFVFKVKTHLFEEGMTHQSAGRRSVVKHNKNVVR